MTAREEVRCLGRLPDGSVCRRLLGELVNGRFEARRLGIIARGGEVAVECGRCQKSRIIDLAPMLDEAAV